MFVPKREYLVEVYRQMAARYAEGRSATEVGEEFGYTSRTVYRALAAYGVKPRKRVGPAPVYERRRRVQQQEVRDDNRVRGARNGGDGSRGETIRTDRAAECSGADERCGHLEPTPSSP